MANLGDKVKDNITGIEGVITAKVEYLNGLISFEVSPRYVPGQESESRWIDEKRIIVLHEEDKE